MALRPDARDILARFGGPVLVVVGADDVLTPPAKARAMADLVPGAELVEISGAGHLANLEQPEAFNAALGRLLARVSAGPSTRCSADGTSLGRWLRNFLNQTWHASGSGPSMSRDSIPWERRQDDRLENLLGALAVTLGERVQERMAASGPMLADGRGGAAVGRSGRGLRTCNLAEALGITMPGASQVVASLVADGLVQRTRFPHDQRQWRLQLTELGGLPAALEAMRARAGTVRELVGTLPFPGASG